MLTLADGSEGFPDLDAVPAQSQAMGSGGDAPTGRRCIGQGHTGQPQEDQHRPCPCLAPSLVRTRGRMRCRESRVTGPGLGEVV